MSSDHRQQRRGSRSSGYYTQSTGYTGSSGYTQNTGYTGSSGYSQSTGDYGESYRSGRSGYTSNDPSYRSGYGDDYTDLYEDDASNYSEGSRQQQSRRYYDVGTQSRRHTTEYEDSTIRSSRHESSRVCNVRRDDDNMSQHSMRSTGSRSTTAFRSDAYSVSGSSIGATTIADGGRGRCPYQIEFSVGNAGKQMSSSKRIISFRFGFADRKALMQGKAGVDCRGEEHDVIISWSITGGKRSIHVDGREIHFQSGKRGGQQANPSKRADIFEATWQMPEDHVCQLMCYAYKPSMGSPEKRIKNWRQYNLTIDGRSFFDLPQIFDLGLKGMGSVKAVAEFPMVIEAKDDWGEMQGFTPPLSRPKNEEVVKRDVQSRIQAQRNILKSRQKSQSSHTNSNSRSRHSRSKDTASASSVSSIGSAHSGYTEDSNLIDMTEGLSIERNIQSNAPSELDEAKQRQAQQQQPMGLQKVPEAGPLHHAPPQVQQAALPATQHYSLVTANQGQVWQQNYPQQTYSHQLVNSHQMPPINAPAVVPKSQNLTVPPITTVSPHQYPINNVSSATTAIPASQCRSISPLTVTSLVSQPPSKSLNSLVAAHQMSVPTPQVNMAPQTTQTILNGDQGPSQLNSNARNLMSQQPPSMEEIRNSMVGADQLSLASSSNGSNRSKFGYY